jgi:hypothetical protein
MEVLQEALPVAGESVLLKVSQRKREGVVDANDGRGVRREFFAEPFGETPPSPVTPWTWRRLNLFRCAGALGNEYP